ncbi:tyrosine-type recombinase/integrase [Tropicimonas sediminicola]|uniref:Site-specific recombinase XerD n=1 Tax=Tropicimonas sediminicola TaxID=1031541 RepID=A0A239DF61_9RHOB|nr:tyrosine-type recombinase/integrase [Tropicimonas sediminicola]SNS30990.1 Site-specific recombinase XerD [Tropicimonas sediminicola]
MVKVDYPGLLKEILPSGNVRWRVRVAGDKRRRVALPCGPDDPRFLDAYLAARAGQGAQAEEEAVVARENSVGWLWGRFDTHMSALVRAGALKAPTQKQRRHLIGRFLAHPHKSATVADFHMNVPEHVVMAFLDTLLETPGARKNTLNAIRAMYRFADERAILRPSPVAAIRASYTSQGGATPWSLDDLRKFRQRHPPGTAAHIALTLFMFTACRVSDAIVLGTTNETEEDGVTWLSWKPIKSSGGEVSIPMMPPLLRAVRGRTVQHVTGTYILSSHGRPFRSTDSFRNRFKKWCVEAGLPDRSPHGIRKAAGHLLAHEGATQYEIMSIHGHANAATSEIYTRDVERRRLARAAAARLSGLDW